eukprot:2281778-Alexandrium_andersonii.AAC.1
MGLLRRGKAGTPSATTREGFTNLKADALFASACVAWGTSGRFGRASRKGGPPRRQGGRMGDFGQPPERP